jgi:guanylate kinase
MSLVYVTGLAGMGKTTLFNEVSSRGVEAYGVDEHNLADWINKSSGVAEEWPKPPRADFDPHQWYENHRYLLSERRIGELKEESDNADTTVYIFGTAEGLKNVRSLFSKVYALYTDNLDELKKRIVGRTDVPYGKTEEEFAQITNWVNVAPDRYQSIGAIVLNAKEPINELADQLLRSST